MTDGGIENHDWPDDSAVQPRRNWRELLPAILLLLIALGWIAGIGWTLLGRSKVDLLSAIALASGPVALILVAGLLLGMTSERSARRFAQTAAQMRHEARHLEASLTAMAAQMDELAARGATTSHEIGSVNDAMSANIDTLGRHALLLGAAATSAREEMKTLMADLPLIEARMNEMTALLASASQIVEGHATALQALLLALTQKGQEAEESTVSAAAGLATQLDRIEAASRAVDPATLASAAEDASRIAQQAGARLSRQMTALADLIARLEARVAEAGAQAERADQDNFARRAALMIDALNSTAIDVTRLLSHEASDAQWAAYLRGERSIFTRSAVRLLSRGDARILRKLYGQDPEFAAHVNRYIHDFETMLRPLLDSSAGGPLAVALLSSDMGKIYVALAQAIERLRA